MKKRIIIIGAVVTAQLFGTSAAFAGPLGGRHGRL
jgi:hypothetical protein